MIRVKDVSSTHKKYRQTLNILFRLPIKTVETPSSVKLSASCLKNRSAIASAIACKNS